jgi:collagenase-like PrtC family protease
MKTVRRIELLAPAKNVEIGQQAILHGADAVYIGAPRFGARSTAGNSIADLARLIDFAHRFDARVYITLNTILRDDELRDAERLIHELYKIESDALIVQDMGITRLDIPPIALHASTQADNRTRESKIPRTMRIFTSRTGPRTFTGANQRDSPSGTSPARSFRAWSLVRQLQRTMLS